MKIALENMIHRSSKTSLALTGVGLVITGVGKAVGGTVGAGIMGFGLANIVLGLTDIFKPLIRN